MMNYYIVHVLIELYVSCFMRNIFKLSLARVENDSRTNVFPIYFIICHCSSVCFHM